MLSGRWVHGGVDIFLNNKQLSKIFEQYLSLNLIFLEDLVPYNRHGMASTVDDIMVNAEFSALVSRCFAYRTYSQVGSWPGKWLSYQEA